MDHQYTLLLLLKSKWAPKCIIIISLTRILQNSPAKHLIKQSQVTSIPLINVVNLHIQEFIHFIFVVSSLIQLGLIRVQKICHNSIQSDWNILFMFVLYISQNIIGHRHSVGLLLYPSIIIILYDSFITISILKTVKACLFP